jgi:hypothetical protein
VQVVSDRRKRKHDSQQEKRAEGFFLKMVAPLRNALLTAAR